MALPRVTAPCAALLLALMAIAPSVTARIYCCTDDRGRRVCGDILPEQCLRRSYNELNSQGMVSKQYQGPLTPEQRAKRDEELAQKKANEQAATEQARRDRAMMASYTSVADIDAKRDRTVAAALAELRGAQERLEAAAARQEKYRQIAERYGKDKPMPEAVRANVRDSQEELQLRRKDIDAKQEELERIRRHFDEDRARFLELTQKHGDTTSVPPAPVKR